MKDVIKEIEKIDLAIEETILKVEEEVKYLPDEHSIKRLLSLSNHLNELIFKKNLYINLII